MAREERERGRVIAVRDRLLEIRDSGNEREEEEKFE